MTVVVTGPNWAPWPVTANDASKKLGVIVCCISTSQLPAATLEYEESRSMVAPGVRPAQSALLELRRPVGIVMPPVVLIIQGSMAL